VNLNDNETTKSPETLVEKEQFWDISWMWRCSSSVVHDLEEYSTQMVLHRRSRVQRIWCVSLESDICWCWRSEDVLFVTATNPITNMCWSYIVGLILLTKRRILIKRALFETNMPGECVRDYSVYNYKIKINSCIKQHIQTNTKIRKSFT